MADGEFDNLTVKGPNVIFQEGFISRLSGNILYYADKRFAVSSSGSISNVDQAFKIGDSYATITSSSLPIVVTIENSSGFPQGTIASAISPYIQAHGALNATIKVELKKTNNNWTTVYGPTSTAFGTDEIKLLGSTSSLTFPNDFPVKGIRFTISGFSGTAYIRQFGYYQYKMLESYPFLTIDGGTLYGNAPSLTNQEIINAIYKWENGEWCPEGLDPGDSVLTFKDNLTKNYTQLFLVISEDNYNAPLLATNQGLVVQKDLAAGGFLSSNQGVLFLGHGLTAETEPPRINLMHSGSGYNTLSITESDGSTLANMKLKDLTATQLKVKSANSVFAVTAGDNGLNQDTYLIPQNPSSGGLGLGTSTYPFKWIDATTVFTNGINSLSAGGITLFDKIANVIHVGAGTYGLELASSVDDNFWLMTRTNTPNPNIWIGYGNGAGGQDGNRENIVLNAGYIYLNNGHVQATAGKWLGWSDAHLYRSNAGVLQVQNAQGQLGTLDAGNIFVDHIVSASGGGVSFFQNDSTYNTIIKMPYFNDGYKNQLNLRPNGTYGAAMTAESGISIRFTSFNIYDRFEWDKWNGSSLTEIMRLETNGTLTIAGNIYIGGRLLYADGSYLRSQSSFIVDANLYVGTPVNTTTKGPLYMNSSNAIGYNISSERFKENVIDLEDCSWIYDLRPVNFDWKDKERKKEEGSQIGLIAEEVNEIAPKLVWLDKEGIPEGVHYEWLAVPILVELKKLRDRIADLRSQIELLKGGEVKVD